MKEPVKEIDYYADPGRYDAEYGFVAADLPWYLERARGSGEPALVLGCGTGRVLFHLARAGLRVDGIDNAPAMLDRARTRALTLGWEVADRVDLWEADIRNFSLPRRYRTILAPLNLLMHLHRDEEFLACLERVKAHLQADGRFLFDLTHPREEMLRDHGGPGGLPLREITVGGQRFLQHERHRYEPDTRISEVTFRFEAHKPGTRSFVSRLRLRMFFEKELRRLLERAEFEILEQLGSFDGSFFDGSQVLRILVTRPCPANRIS